MPLAPAGRAPPDAGRFPKDGGGPLQRLAGPLQSVTLTSPGGPVPLIHQAGAPICLPHTLLAFSTNGLFGSTPVPLKLVCPSGPGSG